MNKELLEKLIKLPHETEWLEFKVNNSNPETLGKYISALSNSACLHDEEKGYLVFGIEDQTHRIVGTNFEPKRTKKGNEDLETWLYKSLNPKIDFKISSLLLEGKNIIVFEIDATPSTPVFFNGTAFIRVATNIKPLDAYPEKAKKIYLKNEKYDFEKDFALQSVVSDNVLANLNYPKMFKLLEINLPPNIDGIIDKLIQEKFLKKRFSQKYDITNLGAVLLANNLKEFDKLARKVVRVIVYKGNNRLETIKEQEFVKGYATGFEGLINYVLDQLPTNEEIGRVFRKEVKMYPEIAIRELIANALIHQDFTIKGAGPMVEIFSNRIEISNPGKPLIPALRFIDHAPQSRNEILASFMRRANICEERGSGIDKVIHHLELFQLPPLTIREDENSLRVIIYAHKALSEMDKGDKIMACYQHCCLKYVASEFMTNESLRNRFDIENRNYPMASRIISDTIKKGLIKDYDPTSKSKKYAKYIPFWA
ncbi:MAG: ATP-binding protein [Candidatus Auribacterota bacterium]